MATASQISKALSARQFAEGLLAGLAASGRNKIAANRIHKAFRQVVIEVEESRVLEVDFSEVDYDALYGQSGWLDQFLARAQRDLMISYPNPSYGRIEIKVTRKEGKEILDEYPQSAAIQRFSDSFYKKLSA